MNTANIPPELKIEYFNQLQVVQTSVIIIIIDINLNAHFYLFDNCLLVVVHTLFFFIILH